jgi:hypothetical protein
MDDATIYAWMQQGFGGPPPSVGNSIPHTGGIPFNISEKEIEDWAKTGFGKMPQRWPSKKNSSNKKKGN